MERKKGMKVGTKLGICVGIAFLFFCLAQGQNYQSITELYSAAIEMSTNAGLQEEAQVLLLQIFRDLLKVRAKVLALVIIF